MLYSDKRRLFAGALILAAGMVVFIPLPDAIAAQPAAKTEAGAETAAAAGQALHIEVATVCEQGNTIFKVKNTGGSWPKTSTFAIYRLGNADS
ncbi:MAG: hypothetical protein VW338_09530 [Rhodospirillaceae bacterium]